MHALTIVHVIAGIIALASGAGALFAKKGSNTHKKSGRFFAISMYAVCIAAMALHLPQGKFFLPSIGIFSLYMAWSGSRVFKIQKSGTSALDTSIAFVAAITGLAMVLYSSYKIVATGNSMSAVLMIFGVICVAMSAKDLLRMLQNKRLKNARVLHLQRMGGAYIAAVTALLVVNAGKISWVAENSWTIPIIWILPSVVATFFITRASIKYNL